MSFVVLMGGALLPLFLVFMCYQAVAQQKYRRLLWYGGLALTNLLAAAGYVTEHHVSAVASLVCSSAAIAVLLSSMVLWLVTPQSQR